MITSLSKYLGIFQCELYLLRVRNCFFYKSDSAAKWDVQTNVTCLKTKGCLFELVRQYPCMYHCHSHVQKVNFIYKVVGTLTVSSFEDITDPYLMNSDLGCQCASNHSNGLTTRIRHCWYSR